MTISKIKSKTDGTFLTLFSIPFIFIGILMIGGIIWTLFVYFQQKSWIPAPAKIIQTNLLAHKSSKSTTYRVYAKYNYIYNGKLYKNATKVSQYTSYDNMLDFQLNLLEKLDEAKENQKTYTCYVNPKKTKESVLFRDLRFGQLLFLISCTLIFGGAGFSMLIIGVKMTSKANKLHQVFLKFPNKPWLQNPNWNDGVITAYGKGELFFSLFVASIWNLVSVPIVISIFSASHKAKLFYLIIIVPIIGIALIIWAIRNILKIKKFGTSVFIMDLLPGVIGGKLSGRIITSINIMPENGFRVHLSSIKRVATSSGRHPSVSETIIWEDYYVVERELLYKDLTRSEIPILFSIPFSCKNSSVASSVGETVLWRLSVVADLAGIDYNVSFEVPVFKTEDSVKNFVLEQKLEGQKEIESNYEIMERAKIRVVPSYELGGKILKFSMGRNLVESFSLAMIVLVLFFIIFIIFYFTASFWAFLFGVIVGLVIILTIIGLLYLLFDYREIEINKCSVILRGGLFGIGRTKNIKSKDVYTFVSERSSQADTVFYKINIVLKNKTKKCVASSLKGSQLSDVIVNELNSLLDK